VTESVNKMSRICLNVSLCLQSGNEIKTVGHHTN